MEVETTNGNIAPCWHQLRMVSVSRGSARMAIKPQSNEAWRHKVPWYLLKRVDTTSLGTYWPGLTQPGSVHCWSRYYSRMLTDEIGTYGFHLDDSWKGQYALVRSQDNEIWPDGFCESDQCMRQDALSGTIKTKSDQLRFRGVDHWIGQVALIKIWGIELRPSWYHWMDQQMRQMP